MTPRIQFRTTDDEFAIIEKNSIDAGYSSISQFVKELALAYPNTLQNSNASDLSFAEIYDDVKRAVADTVANAVENPSAETRFVLRDITPSWGNTPQHENGSTGTIPKPLRASVGKHFYSEVKKKKFPNVRYTGKVDKYGTAIYEVYFEDAGEDTL
ncbi:MAG: hypothetical protein AAGU27_26275 [Dehalobacterium sp.]